MGEESLTASGLIQGLSVDLTGQETDRLATLMSLVEQELAVQTRSTVVTVENVGTATLQAGGKRLRPALVLLSALATGLPFDDSRLAKLAACLELVHMATLVHDDVIDEAETRRGKPTAASLYGNTAAILSGDVLLARAMRLLALDGDIRMIRAVSEAVVDLAEGEVLELEARGQFDLTQEAHHTILERKTASLISCCCRIGAMAAGAPLTIEESLVSYGHNLGLGFQIADDLLDYCGDPSVTGKPRGTDYRDGQATLPLIELRANLTDDELSQAQAHFGNGVTDAEIDTLCAWMQERGSLDKARSAARDLAANARQALSDLPPSAYTGLLSAVATFVTERDA